MVELQTFTLPAGSVCHRNGIPFALQHATQIECHPGNWVLIGRDSIKPLECHVTVDGAPCGTSVGLAELPPHSPCRPSVQEGPSEPQETFDSTGTSKQRICMSWHHRMLLVFRRWLLRERS